MKRTEDLFTKVEKFLIRVTALLCLLHTLYQVVKHEFGW